MTGRINKLRRGLGTKNPSTIVSERDLYPLLYTVKEWERNVCLKIGWKESWCAEFLEPRL